MVVCPICADACADAPKVNDDVVLIGACVPKERAVVLAGVPNERGPVDVAVLPKVKFAVVAGTTTEWSFKIHNF